MFLELVLHMSGCTPEIVAGDAGDAAGSDSTTADVVADTAAADVASDTFVAMLDASSDVTCTYTKRNVQLDAGCGGCNLPLEVTAQDNNVPVTLGTSGLYGDDTCLDGHSIELNGPTTIGPYPSDGGLPLGWVYGNAFALANSQVHQPPPCDAGPDGAQFFDCQGYFPLLPNSNGVAHITVTGDTVTLSQFHFVHYPGVLGCGIIHGCVVETIDCSGGANL